MRFAYQTLTLLALGALVFAGCGRNDTPSNNAAEKPGDTGKAATPAAGDFKVALVTPGPISDNGWNAGAYKGLEAVKAETGAEVQNVEAKDPGSQEENLREFARKGYKLVFGHGNEFEDMALKLETQFPNTVFAISSGRKAGKNTQPIILQLEDGAYLLGMVAAGMSKANKIGAVGAKDIVPVRSVFVAFEAGAKAINPAVTVVKPVYTDSWDDVGKAKQQTLALLDQGCDVIVQDVDAAAVGVFQAVQERSKGGKTLYALGTNSDQNSIAPDVILASAPIYQDKAFVAIAKQVKDGTFKASETPYGMKSGAIGFVLNPQLEAKLPADLKTKIEQAKQKILDGTLAVPRVSS